MAKAVRFDGYGGVDVLYVADVEVPTATPDHVVVAVRAAGINPGEVTIRTGGMHERWPSTFPSGEGSDLAGVVSAVGEGVTGFAVGDEVFGWTDLRGSHAEYVLVPAGRLLPRPAALPWEVAGSLFVAGTTAYAAVRAVDAGKDDTVVVSGAAGGVGSIAVQLLTARGAHVIGIASPANHDYLASLGVTPVAYGDGLVDRVRAAAPAGVDAFIDLFGPEYVRLAVELGVDRARINTIISFALVEEFGIKAEGSATAATAEVMGELADLIVAGTVQVPIAATYPLDRVVDAYTELEQRHARGKIVLIP